MCGICGIVDLQRPAETETVRAMFAELRHRGPDGEGLFEAPGVALGHARLAIIDLSDGGRQPFASDDGTLQLLHNGEVFNYLELRAELEQLGTSLPHETDTEVVLRAYEAVGAVLCRAFQRHVGARRCGTSGRRRLFCSRDRFGIKPFVFHLRRATGSRSRASREPSAATHPSERGRTPRRSATSSRRATPIISTRRSSPGAAAAAGALAHVRRRRAAARALLAARAGRPAGRPSRSFRRELFLDSIRLRLRSDVPLGTALSGGLDSSAVAVAIDHLLRTEKEHARPVGERQRTFTVYFDDAGFDERPFAEAVVGQILSEPRWLTFDEQDACSTCCRSRRRAGRALRVDERGRAVVRDARGGAGAGSK